MSVVQHNQGIDGFFDSVFGFLRRKTDLYTHKDKAEELVSKYLKKHQDLFEEGKRKEELLKKKKEEEKRK